MDITTIWEADGYFDTLDSQVRIVKMDEVPDEEYIMEIVSRRPAGFIQRIRDAINHIFYGQEIVFSIVPLAKSDIVRLSCLKQ